MPNGIFVSTAMVSVDERTDFWREATKLVFDTMPGGDEPLEGSVRSRYLGSLLLGEISFNRQNYRRDRRIILQSGLDCYLVQVLSAGSMTGNFSGTVVSARQGDICILDLARTFESQADAGSRLSVAVPRRSLEKAVGYRNLHGAVLRAEWQITRLLALYISGLCSLDRPLPTVQASAVEDAAISMLSAALKGDDVAGQTDLSPLSVALRQRVLEFIEQNLQRGELSPELIQRRFNVSRSHLYRAFENDGGVAKVLRERRLDAAFAELVRSGNTTRSIARIAYDVGFASSQQFLRSFRARFGAKPSEVRGDGFAKWQSSIGLQSHFIDLSNRIPETHL